MKYQIKDRLLSLMKAKPLQRVYLARLDLGSQNTVIGWIPKKANLRFAKERWMASQIANEI